MRVLITGGAGFIGSHVADALLAEGCIVEILDNLSTGRRENVPAAAPLREVDLRDRAAVAAAVAAFRPQVICHHAAQASVAISVREPILDAEVNVLGTIHLLDAAVANGVERFVFASTGGAIYGEAPRGGRAAVGKPPLPASPYAASKLAAEGYLEVYRQEHGLKCNVLRYANVYGPRQDPHGEAGVVAIFARRLLENAPVQVNARSEAGDAGCIRDYVFIEDVVRANLSAIRGQIEAPIVNVCSGVETPTLEIAEMLKAAVGSGSEIRFGPRRPGDLQRSVLEPSPEVPPKVALSEGLKLTVGWFRNAGERPALATTS
jgi:UDP-glucose 4-epimerase